MPRRAAAISTNGPDGAVGRATPDASQRSTVYCNEVLDALLLNDLPIAAARSVLPFFHFFRHAKVTIDVLHCVAEAHAVPRARGFE